jgi:hypothetical protein
MKTLLEFNTFLDSLVLKRFESIDNLNIFISQFLGFSVFLEDTSLPMYPSLDDKLGVNLDMGDKDLYVDIYYLKDNQDNLLITEISLDSDHALKSIDKDKKIIGVAQ